MVFLKELKASKDRRKFLEEVIVPNLLEGTAEVTEELEGYKEYLSAEEYRELVNSYIIGVRDLLDNLKEEIK